MPSSSLSNSSLSIIDQYIHFKLGSAVCSVPYFNNKTVRARAALRALIGKGSPKDILDELQSRVVKQHIDVNALADESLKKLLVDNNLGIECSGFAYYVLNAESEVRGKGTLNRHIHFVNCKGILGKLRASMRPVENCDVATFADDSNSKVIQLNDVKAGDMITMLRDEEESERDHILIVHEIETDNSRPIKIHYSHAVAYAEDGIYGTGVRQGAIELPANAQSIFEGVWSENGPTASAEHIFNRAKKSKTEVRRLNWL